MSHHDSQLLKDLNESYRELARLSEALAEMREELDRAEKLAADWEECANQFFWCAGKDKTASWEQFEKAATTYQFLKKKSSEK